MLCACSTDIIGDLFVCGGQYVSLCDGQIYDGIAFDIWYVVPTLCMFFGVNLGWVPTLGVKMWLKMGWCTTFEIFECIREADRTERFLSLVEIQVFAWQRHSIAPWHYCRISIAAAQTMYQSKKIL